MQIPQLGFINLSYPEQAQLKMAYWQWGEEDNPNVLVCVHGLTRQSQDFAQLAQVLAKTHRVICPDIVGRGRSDWFSHPENYNIQCYANDMYKLFEQLNIQSSAWVGTSMGGLIGMVFAHTHPSLITRMVLNDIGPELEYAAIEKIGQYVGVIPHFASFADGMLHVREVSQSFGQHSEAQWESLCRPMLVQDENGWRLHYDPAIRQSFVAIDREQLSSANAQLWQVFENIKIPILVLRGEYSDLLSEPSVNAMVARGYCTQAITIKDTGHAPSLVHQAQIDCVRAFIAEGA